MEEQAESCSSAFAGKLAALMAERKLSQAALASAIGVSQGTVSNWSRGSLPKAGELYRLAKYFGRKMEWFLEGEAAVEVTEREMDTTPPSDLDSAKLKSVMEKIGVNVEWWEKVIDVLASGEFVGAIRKNVLTNPALVSNVPPDMTHWDKLKRRLKPLLAERGRRYELAKHLGLSRAAISAWFKREGASVPQGESLLALQVWVEAEEKKQQSPEGVQAPTGRKPKPRKKPSNDTKPSSGRRG